LASDIHRHSREEKKTEYDISGRRKDDDNDSNNADNDAVI